MINVSQNMVKVIHGANDDLFAVAGTTVATIQNHLADAFNIPIEAFAWVNGKLVGEEFILCGNDILEFIFPEGVKGAIPKQN